VIRKPKTEVANRNRKMESAAEAVGNPKRSW
jgi:hypothetical protein